MHRLVLGLAFGCLTFLVGTSASVLYRFLAKSDDLLTESYEIIRKESTQRQSLTIVGGMDACGPEANFHTYDLSDGTRISTSCCQMSSSHQAGQELQNRLAQATEIIERKPNLDENGNAVGERVVAKSAGIIAVSTYRNSFCSTEAPSLKHLQWLEKR